MTQTDSPPLAGHTALITGGARRLGAAMAQALHAVGANIVIHHLKSTAGCRDVGATHSMRRRKASAMALQADLLDTAHLPQLIEATVERFGSLDILINNASTFYATPVGEITTAQFDDLIGTNLRAPLFLAQAAAAELRRRRGLIINMVDIHGMKPLKRYPTYSSAKAALIMLTRSLARELAPEVRVNGIAPGPVMLPADIDVGAARPKSSARRCSNARASPRTSAMRRCTLRPWRRMSPARSWPSTAAAARP